MQIHSSVLDNFDTRGLERNSLGDSNFFMLLDLLKNDDGRNFTRIVLDKLLRTMEQTQSRMGIILLNVEDENSSGNSDVTGIGREIDEDLQIVPFHSRPAAGKNLPYVEKVFIDGENIGFDSTTYSIPYVPTWREGIEKLVKSGATNSGFLRRYGKNIVLVEPALTRAVRGYAVPEGITQEARNIDPRDLDYISKRNLREQVGFYTNAVLQVRTPQEYGEIKGGHYLSLHGMSKGLSI